MSINLIGVPTNHGCDKDGTQYGPQKLRQSQIIDIIEKNQLEVNDLGDIHVEIIDQKDKLKDNKNIKYYKSIYNVNNELAEKVYESLNSEKFTLIIGGDHSIALGSISGASKNYGNLGVVWIDAHGDFNTDEISESKNSHGMPLSFLCGYGKKELVDLYYEGQKIKEENVFHIGGRDFNIEEAKLLKSSKVNLYDKEIIDKIGFENILEDIKDKCIKQNIDAIHISLDIDFMDESLVFGTGTRVKGGYTVEDTKYILKELFKCGLVKSMDFVEFNPLLDEDNTTLELCKDLLNYTFEQYKENTNSYNI